MSQIKASMVIFSHLSDAQHCEGKKKDHHINFAKFLLNRYPNTNDRIVPDNDYKDFIKQFPNA